MQTSDRPCVVQVDRMGCGVACVAFLTRRSYAKALELFVGLAGDPLNVGFSRRVLVAALNRAGLAYVFRPLGRVAPANRTSLVPIDGVVFIKDRLYRRGHYLVRSAEGWMDPDSGAFLRRLPGSPRSFIAPI